MPLHSWLKYQSFTDNNVSLFENMIQNIILSNVWEKKHQTIASIHNSIWQFDKHKATFYPIALKTITIISYTRSVHIYSSSLLSFGMIWDILRWINVTLPFQSIEGWCDSFKSEITFSCMLSASLDIFWNSPNMEIVLTQKKSVVFILVIIYIIYQTYNDVYDLSLFWFGWPMGILKFQLEFPRKWNTKGNVT